MLALLLLLGAPPAEAGLGTLLKAAAKATKTAGKGAGKAGAAKGAAKGAAAVGGVELAAGAFARSADELGAVAFVTRQGDELAVVTRAGNQSVVTPELAASALPEEGAVLIDASALRYADELSDGGRRLALSHADAAPVPLRRAESGWVADVDDSLWVDAGSYALDAALSLGDLGEPREREGPAPQLLVVGASACAGVLRPQLGFFEGEVAFFDSLEAAQEVHDTWTWALFVVPRDVTLWLPDGDVALLQLDAVCAGEAPGPALVPAAQALWRAETLQQALHALGPAELRALDRMSDYQEARVEAEGATLRLRWGNNQSTLAERAALGAAVLGMLALLVVMVFPKLIPAAMGALGRQVRRRREA